MVRGNICRKLCGIMGWRFFTVSSAAVFVASFFFGNTGILYVKEEKWDEKRLWILMGKCC